MTMLWSITVPTTINSIRLIYPWVTISYGFNNCTIRQYYILTGKLYHQQTYSGISWTTMYFRQNASSYVVTIGEYNSNYNNIYSLND